MPVQDGDEEVRQRQSVLIEYEKGVQWYWIWRPIKNTEITVFRLMIGICLSGWGWDQQWDDKKPTALPQIQVFTHFHFLSLPQI